MQSAYEQRRLVIAPQFVRNWGAMYKVQKYFHDLESGVNTQSHSQNFKIPFTEFFSKIRFYIH